MTTVPTLKNLSLDRVKSGIYHTETFSVRKHQPLHANESYKKAFSESLKHEHYFTLRKLMRFPGFSPEKINKLEYFKILQNCSDYFLCKWKKRFIYMQLSSLHQKVKPKNKQSYYLCEALLFRKQTETTEKVAYDIFDELLCPERPKISRKILLTAVQQSNIQIICLCTQKLKKYFKGFLERVDDSVQNHFSEGALVQYARLEGHSDQVVSNLINVFGCNSFNYQVKLL